MLYKAYRGGFYMSFIKILREKKLWIGLAISLAVLLIWILTAAALIQKGTIPGTSGVMWLRVSYLISTLIGGVAAGRRNRGNMLTALLIALMEILFVSILSLAMYGRIDLSDGWWKCILLALTGSFLAGLMTAGRSKAGRQKKPRASALRRARPVR